MLRLGSGRVQSRCWSRPMSSPRLPLTDTLKGPPSGRLISFSMVSVSPIGECLSQGDVRLIAGERDALCETATQHVGPLPHVDAACRDQDGGAHDLRGLMRGNRNPFFGADIQAPARPPRRKRQIGGGQFAAGTLAELQGGDALL